ncbi:anti-sigma-F factor antagonist RsfA [Mycobacterium tuberculosis variant africanum]|nr:anti-sigma-F factor antagonist RsfA [Mycobacterium tuberculosis variant africanum]
MEPDSGRVIHYSGEQRAQGDHPAPRLGCDYPCAWRDRRRHEHTWQDLVTKAAAATTAPEPLVVNLNGLDFMGCCAVAVLAHEGRTVVDAGAWTCAW